MKLSFSVACFGFCSQMWDSPRASDHRATSWWLILKFREFSYWISVQSWPHPRHPAGLPKTSFKEQLLHYFSSGRLWSLLCPQKSDQVYPGLYFNLEDFPEITSGRFSILNLNDFLLITSGRWMYQNCMLTILGWEGPYLPVSSTCPSLLMSIVMLSLF